MMPQYTEEQIASVGGPDKQTPLSYPAYLAYLRRKMREAVKETQRLDARWNRINDELNRMLDRQDVTDILARTRTKQESLALQDALEGGRWWREKAVYLATIIQSEIMCREEIGS
jgi:hypothetical protein